MKAHSTKLMNILVHADGRFLGTERFADYQVLKHPTCWVSEICSKFQRHFRNRG